MAILEKLNRRINELKENSQEEINRIKNLLTVIDDSIVALDNEEVLKDFDFSIAINLVNSNSFGIIDLNKCIKDIKNILVAKYKYNQSYLTLTIDQLQAIKSFKERLGYLKEELDNRIREDTVRIDEKTLDNLIEFSNFLAGKKKKKYYTYEMIEAFFEVFDYDEFTYKDIEELVDELSVSRNIRGKISEDETNFEEIKDLFIDYVTNIANTDLLDKYHSELCYQINIDNAKKILMFLDKENLINKFSLLSLIQIVTYGKYYYIKNFYYEFVLPKNDNVKKIYFEDSMSCVWINQNTDNKKNNHVKLKNRNTLLSTINECNEDDIWENIRLINENEDILAEHINLSNIDYLWVITKPTWLIKKNIGLLRLFDFHNVKLSALVQNDLEDKIHFSIELGLYDGLVSSNYVLDGHKDSSKEEYLYWFYKMQKSSKEEFFKDYFISTMNADIKVIDKIIDDSFVINYYDALIPNYDTYNEVIKKYLNSSKGDRVIPYYDSSILNDELVKDLEEHMIHNIYAITDEIANKPNNYVYLFDKCVISRYKVLRNLSILKREYGYLDNNMVITAIVRNSFINKDEFDYIKDDILKGRLMQ